MRLSAGASSTTGVLVSEPVSPVQAALPDEGAEQPDPRRWWALTVLAAAQLMIVLDASIVNIALPSAQDDLGISNADRQWVVTAYTLAFGALLLLGGRIADYTGRKRTFVVGLLGFAAASAIGGLAPSQELLFAARALQGAFAALMAPAALSLVTVTFVEPKERAKAFGVFGALSGGGAAIGLIVGGVLTEYASWRWCLGVNVPVALIVAAAAVPLVHESKAKGDTRYDVPGVLLATFGLFSLVYGFTEAARAENPDNPRYTSVQGWTHPSTLTFLILAVVLLVAFVAWERRTRNPMLPLRIVLDRNRGGSYLVFLFVGAGLFAMFLFRVPAVQCGNHPQRRSRLPAAPATGSQAADGAGSHHGRGRHVAADPHRPGHGVLVPRAPRRAADEHRAGGGLHPCLQHRVVRGGIP
jgi:MFS family permease